MRKAAKGKTFYSLIKAVISMEKYERILALREDADMTRKKVGEAVNVPQCTYAYYESGEPMIPPEVLRRLADFYGVSVDYLLRRTGKSGI